MAVAASRDGPPPALRAVRWTDGACTGRAGPHENRMNKNRVNKWIA